MYFFHPSDSIAVTIHKHVWILSNIFAIYRSHYFDCLCLISLSLSSYRQLMLRHSSSIWAFCIENSDNDWFEFWRSWFKRLINKILLNFYMFLFLFYEFFLCTFMIWYTYMYTTHTHTHARAHTHTHAHTRTHTQYFIFKWRFNSFSMIFYF